MKKWKRVSVFLVLAIFMAAMLVGCAKDDPIADNAEQEGKVKVGFVYIGVPGDAGWTYSHDQARQYLENEVPEVETIFLEKVSEGADAQNAIEQLIQQGCTIIFANSFGYGDAVMEVAERNPDVTFLHCSGMNTAENVGTYFGRIYQIRYLNGIIAGKMTKTNELGYVAAYPIPEVIRGINAFTLGAQSVNPDVKVKVVWTNTWYDPVAEKDSAKSLIEAGCDVIAQHQDTYAPQQAAEEAGVYSIGYHSDMHRFAPEANLTSAIWNWGPYYVNTVKAIISGEWKSESYWGGIDEGVVLLAPLSNKVPDEVKDILADKELDISNGNLYIFEGPIKGQDGSIKVPEGKKMTDIEMLNMDWFVQGVEGSI